MTTGAWKNYYDLEESLTLVELMEIYKAMVLRDWSTQRVIAAVQGVDLPSPFDDSSGARTVDDVRKQALSGLDKYNDIADVKGAVAAQEGFGIGLGLGYESE